jgi:hypothetical protein
VNKKGVVGAFELTSRLGYYALVLMITSVLFMFLAIAISGSSLKTYQNNYGTATITLEERVFTCTSYVDPITDVRYPKIFDHEKLSNEALDKCLGITGKRDPNGVQIDFRSSVDATTSTTYRSMNYVDRPDFEKHYPVLYVQEDGGFKTMILTMSFWKT